MRRRNLFTKHLIIPALFLSAPVLLAQANPFRGVTTATDDIRAIATAVGAILGGLFALIGGSRVGWKMVHREEWTADLIMAIGGFVVGVVCVIAM